MEYQLTYTLIRKQVKNINLRIRADGEIIVSAHPCVSKRRIDAFVKDREDWIRQARERQNKRKNDQVEAPFSMMKSRQEALDWLTEVCKEIYPPFMKMGVSFPEIKVRKMTSCWGTCRKERGVVTLNQRLVQVPRKYAAYVAIHEFCHLIVPNHSRDFYQLMEHICPDYRQLKKELNRYTFTSGDQEDTEHGI